MAQNPIPTAATGEGVTTPAVENLPTHTTSRVAIPQWHTKTTLESHAEKGEETWESTHDGLAVSQAPAPGTRQASRCRRRCLGRVGSPKIPETDQESTIPDKDFWEGESLTA